MAMYLGEDKVASLGSICNVSGSASKNLLNINLVPSGSVITNNGDGTLTFANNGSNVGYVDIGVRFSQIFDGVVGNTYIASFDNSFSQTDRNYRFYLLGANLYINKNTPFVLTQAMLDSNVILYGGYNQTSTISNFQIEKGSTITSYEEYYEPSLSIKNSNGVFQEVELNAPVILYTSESGTFDPITLTEEAEHFKYVEVFGVGNTMICSVKIPMDLYNTGSLFTAGASYQYQCGVSLTGKSMTFIYNRRLNISSNAWDNGNYFKIYRIIGYR